MGTEEPFKDIRSIERSRTEAIEHYDRIAGFYDQLEGALEKRYRSMALDHLDLQPSEKVLEIGFGTGHALKEIVESIENSGSVAGIDISSEMCRVTKERLIREDCLEHVDLIRGDTVWLPLKADIFDKVFISFTLELLGEDEIQAVVGEIKRIMKDDGLFGAVTLSKEEDAFVELYEIFHDIFPKFLDCRPIHPKKILEDQDFVVEEVIEEKMGVLPIKVITARSG